MLLYFVIMTTLVLVPQANNKVLLKPHCGGSHAVIRDAHRGSLRRTSEHSMIGFTNWFIPLWSLDLSSKYFLETKDYP